MRRKSKAAAPEKTARERYAAIKTARENRQRALLVEWWSLQIPSEEEDALEVAAEVEVFVDELERNVRADAHMSRERADRLAAEAAELESRGSELVTLEEQLTELRVKAGTSWERAAAAESRLGSAIIAATPASQLATLEADLAREHAEAGTADDEVSELETKIADLRGALAEAEGLRAEAVRLREDAAESEAAAHDFATSRAPGFAMSFRAERDRRRRLRRQVKPSKSVDSAAVLSNDGFVVNLDDDGRFRGVELPIEYIN